MNVRERTYREALREALREEMERDQNVYLLGEDIGLYGGYFKVTEGLIERFGPERVVETPIMESTIVGMAAGSAMTGLRPVVEIMFSDFITFGMDALVNYAAKIHYLSKGEINVPMVVRLPSGAGTGAGAQHSQNLEAWFCHVPGLIVCAPSTPAQAKGLMKAAIRNNNPVVFIEYKSLYDVEGMVPEESSYMIPLCESYRERRGSDVTIVSWGPALDVVKKTSRVLSEEGISLEIINPLTLYPLDMDPIIESVKKTSRLIIVHDGPKTGGVGGEIAAKIAEGDAFSYLDAPVLRIAGLDVPPPATKNLESLIVPHQQDVAQAVYQVLGLV